MNHIRYRIVALEPLLVTSLQGDPNSSVAFDYIPGSVLRGMLISRYLGSRRADSDDGLFRRLFFDGTTRYLNGYPLDADNRQGLPVPASWYQMKDQQKSTISDFAVELPDEDDRQQWQAVATPFYTRSYEDVRLIQPMRTVAVHTQRTARFGRAVSAYRPDTSGRMHEWLDKDAIAGAIYRYDALAAGQTFQATILCEHDDDATLLRSLLDGNVTIGGSRSGGYGRAEIRLCDDEDAEQTEDFSDVPEEILIVTVQSNVLLRDARGQFTVDPSLFCQVLSHHLGVHLEPEAAFLRAEIIGGFNRTWGLPLPQTLSIRMGSVLVCRDPGCDPARLKALETRGIGDRRTEGFGRIVFNRQGLPTLTPLENLPLSDSRTAPAMREPAAHKLATLMVNRMLRQRLDAGVLAAANTTTILRPPSNAQISRLRSIILHELSAATPGTDKLCAFIESVRERSTARRQFEQSTVNKEPLLQWLQRLLCYGKTWKIDTNDWIGLLNLTEAEVNIKLGDVQVQPDAALRLEYVLRLIDLVLAHAAKKRREENE